MSEPVFLVDQAPPLGLFQLTGAEGRHAANVRRMRPGEPLLLSDGHGTMAYATVVAARSGALDVDVTERRTHPQADPRIVAVQAIAKGDRAEAAVQAMTEAGVDEIVPWSARRCVARWDGDRAARGVERWRATAREAAKQSRRAWLPVVTRPVSTEQLVEEIHRREACALVLHEEASERLTGASLPFGGVIMIVIGPEGGIAPEELARLAEVSATPVRLGDTVLRTSTAGVAAIAVLSARLGRW